jgi:hypothetical protein
MRNYFTQNANGSVSLSLAPEAPVTAAVAKTFERDSFQDKDTAGQCMRLDSRFAAILSGQRVSNAVIGEPRQSVLL